jgi:glycine/D-amino acid oxidase-like deaminating enzyme
LNFHIFQGITMKSTKADVVICGAGIAGASAAYHLAVKEGVRNVLIVDERSPLTLTSDKSTEAYRNWWPGPGDTMVRFMNRSIDLLDELARDSDNFFNMNRRGYVFLTSRQEQASLLERTAGEISSLGAGPLRYHRGRPDDPPYPAGKAEGFDPGLNGADLSLGRELIREGYPFISDKGVAMLHPRRCGWLSAQQLGMYLLDRAKGAGARFLMGRVAAVESERGRVREVRIRVEEETLCVSTDRFVIAAGPYLKEAGAMIGLDLPVFNELHGKISFRDPLGVVPRDVPLMVWTDPVALSWTDEEREELARNEETQWLLEEFPGGVHFRPEGGKESQIILALWTYDVEPREPVWPPVFKPEYGEIVMRGMASVVPGLSAYLRTMAPPFVDGGYYCKTRENRPLIGPLPVKGAFVIGALSGFGIMGSMAAGELLARHVSERALPDYAPAFLLSRYEDPAYQRMLANWDATAGQL